MFASVATPRKIFVCSAGFGEGHNTAARNLVEALNQVGAGAVQAEFVDTLGSRNPRLYEWMRQGYVQVMNRAPRLWAGMYRLMDSPALGGASPLVKLLAAERQVLAQRLADEKPVAVVSTYPYYGYALEEIARRGGPKDFLKVTVVTDSISINSVWYRCESDYFCVPNEATATVMRQAGVAGEKLRTLGFPVSPRYAEGGLPARPDPAGPEGCRVLYMINAGKKAAPETVRRLLELRDIQLTITVGRDMEAHAMVERAIGAYDRTRRPVKLIGWTKEVPNLLASHHLLISKAGGATTQETIAAGCPMVISQIAPGQEEGNAQLLVDNGAGCLALSPKEIAGAVENAFRDDGKVCREWTANIARLSRPDAARENARFILKKAGIEGFSRKAQGA